MKYRPRKIFGGAHSNNFSAQRTNCRLWRNYSQMLSSARARTGDWAEVRGFDLARNSGWSRNHYWLYRKRRTFFSKSWPTSSMIRKLRLTIFKSKRYYRGHNTAGISRILWTSKTTDPVERTFIGRKWFKNHWVKYEIHRPILIFSFPPLRIPAARLSFYLQIVASNRSNQTSKNLFGENASSRSRRKHQRYQIRIKNIYDATITF
jgi:hypothetical protein